MSHWRSITFDDLAALYGRGGGVYVIFHDDEVVAIGHHVNLMSKLAGYLGTLSRKSQVDTGSRRMASGTAGATRIDYYNNYHASPSDCIIKYRLGADETTAEKLIKRLGEPEWNRRPKRARSFRQAAKEGKRPLTYRDVDVETQFYMEELAELGHTNTRIAEMLNARGMKSWTGRSWVAVNVDTCLEPWRLHNRDKFKGPHMEERFNPRISYAAPESEATKSLREMLRAS